MLGSVRKETEELWFIRISCDRVNGKFASNRNVVLYGKRECQGAGRRSKTEFFIILLGIYLIIFIIYFHFKET